MTRYTPQELAAVVLARDLRDSEVGACGAAAAVPFAAMRLAQQTHAPGFMICVEIGLNPKPEALIDEAVDPRAHRGIECAMDMYDLFVNSERGIDVWFASGVQTDRFGNINLHGVGLSEPRPTFRGPGIGNAGLPATAGRWYNYPSRHDRRHFVPEVDFVTAIGAGGRHHGRPAGSTVGAGGYGSGCALIVTPIAVLGFRPVDHVMCLVSHHPGISPEEVRRRTGFDLADNGDVVETPAPSADELDLLRRVVDPSGLLRG